MVQHGDEPEQSGEQPATVSHQTAESFIRCVPSLDDCANGAEQTRYHRNPPEECGRAVRLVCSYAATPDEARELCTCSVSIPATAAAPAGSPGNIIITECGRAVTHCTSTRPETGQASRTPPPLRP